MGNLNAVSPAQSPLSDLVQDYLDDRTAAGLSRKTIHDAYGYPLRSVFLPFCEREGVRTVPDVTQRVMNRFTTELLQRGGKRGPLSPHSVNAYTRNVNLFLSWARRQGELVEARGHLPKLPRRLIDVLDRDEILRMEAAAPTERDKLIIAVLAQTGMRAGELVGLRPDDLVLHNRKSFLRVVHAKGGDEREVGVHPDLARRLRRFIDHGRPADSPNRIFVALRRSPGGRIDALGPSGVLQMLREVAGRARVSKRVYTHLFRHSFITHALRKGMHPIMIRKIVGHSDSSTMIERNYEHLVGDDTYSALMEMFGDN